MQWYLAALPGYDMSQGSSIVDTPKLPPRNSGMQLFMLFPEKVQVSSFPEKKVSTAELTNHPKGDLNI